VVEEEGYRYRICFVSRRLQMPYSGEWLTGVVIRAYGKMLNERHMSALILSADIYTWLVDLEPPGRKEDCG
jgi:hypothetical protein